MDLQQFKLGFLYFLFLNATTVCVSHHYETVPLHKKYPAQFNTFVKGEKMETLYQCMEFCLSYKLCKELWYNLEHKTCSLNADDKDRQSKWRFDTGLRLPRKKLPEVLAGNCMNNDCAIDEQCLQTSPGHVCAKHEFSTVKCPMQWARFEDVCISPFFEYRTWSEAKAFCDTKRATLLEISSREYLDQIEIVDFAAIHLTNEAFRYTWTGLVYSVDQSAWIWDGSGSLLSLEEFERFHQPPSITTHCVALNTFAGNSWTALDCNTALPFTCQSIAPGFWP